MTNKSDSFVSVCVVLDEQYAPIQTSLTLITQIQATLADSFVDHEVVVVHQPGDGAQVGAQIEALLHHVPGIRFLQLAYRVADDVAVAAGLENAIGDFVLLFDMHRDPIGLIPALVDRCRQGADHVIGVCPNQRYSNAYALIRPLTQAIIRSIGYDLPRHATTLRCLSRRAVNAATRAGKFHHQLYVRIQKTGMPTASMEYSVMIDSPTRTLGHGLKEAARLLVFNSTRPLRWMNALGTFVSLILLIAALGWGVGRLMAGDTVRSLAGPFLVSIVAVLFMLLFVTLAFFSEYLGRLLDERGETMQYSVALDMNSSVMLDENRENVLLERTGRN